MTDIVNPIQNHTAWQLGQPWQSQPGAENIAQFQSLLASVGTGLKTHSNAGPLKVKSPVDQVPNLLEKTALEVGNTETALLELRTEVQRQFHIIQQTPDLDSTFTDAVVREKYAVGLHAAAIGLVGSKADSLDDEFRSIQKGR